MVRAARCLRLFDEKSNLPINALGKSTLRLIDCRDLLPSKFTNVVESGDIRIGILLRFISKLREINFLYYYNINFLILIVLISIYI